MSFLIIVGQWAKTFRHFVKKNPKASSKLRSTCPKRTLCWKKRFGGIFLSLADIEWKIVEFCRRTLSRVVGKALFVSRGTLWGESFSKKFVFFQFWIFREKHFGFSGEFSNKFIKIALFSCPWGHFEWEEFFGENILIFFGYWVTNFCLLVGEKTVELSKLPSTCP